jgi:protein-disulfide isomerase
MHPQTSQMVRPVGAGDHALGPPHAPVTLVEYGDFECPRCKQAAGAVKLLIAHFGPQLRYVFRHFPLEEIHPHALLAAEAAECAGAQGEFWRMHDVLFEQQAHLERERLLDYARTLALDMGRFAADLDNDIHLPRVREHQRDGRSSGVRATPGFFVNGQVRDVSYELHSLVEAVESALRSAGPS